MTPEQFHLLRKTVATPSGKISYVERGEGPVALFVHGAPLNGYHWRHALDELGDLRRCLAPDLMGFGHSEIALDQDLTFDAQAQMLLEFLDVHGIEQVDLVGNDSGGGIAQILAAKVPNRIRSLTLTNCDVHDNWPPEAAMPIFNAAKAGQFGQTLAGLLANPTVARSSEGLGIAYEFPEKLSDELLNVYLSPITATTERQSQVNRYVAAMDCAQTLRIYDRLKVFQKPTLIIWGDNDIFFPVHWAQWLGETIPGTCKVVVLEGARLFFPEERSDQFCDLVRAHWQAAAA